jgi:hypothetical protein
MRRVLFVVLKVIGTVLVLPPLLLLATCTYTSYSPHLRLDALNRALMDAPRHPELGWRTVDVNLTPDHLQVGESESAVIERLEAGGFGLFGDYSTDVGPSDIHLDDDMPQAGLDQMHLQARAWHNERGVTHIFERGGRAAPACGENLLIEIGLVDGALTQATGYSRWTCL